LAIPRTRSFGVTKVRVTHNGTSRK
jgi:hypothetical protein